MSATTQDTAELRELLGYLNNCWDDERRALSRQMHDNLGSTLTALTMHLGLLTSKLPQDPMLLERAAQMKQLLYSVIETNRAMQHKLWNDKLEFLGLRAAISELVNEFSSEHGVPARCSLPDEEPACPRGHGVVLLRACEEALRNVARHAQARGVDVVLDDTDDAIVLVIKDDGVGVSDPAQVDGKHGLRTLRERVLYLGGSLTLAPNGSRGCMLSVSLPKPAATPLSAA